MRRRHENTMAAAGIAFYIISVILYIMMAAIPEPPPDGMHPVRQRIREESLIQ